MNCEQALNQNLVEKYVAGQLPNEEMTAFEEHYFGCDDCLTAVQLGQAIHFGSATSAEPRRVIQMPARKVRGRWMYAVAAAAAVIVVAVVGHRAFVQAPKQEVARTGQSPIQNPVPAVPESPKSNPAEPQLLASNIDLGEIDPLAYRPSVLRGGGDDSSERFQKAMESYVKRDYRRAVNGLASIPVSVPGGGKPEDHLTDAGVQLYLGISQLMLNQNADAIRALQRTADYGDTPYLESAEFYLAKGLIRQKQYSQAADQLRRTVALKGDRQDEALQLLEKLNTLVAR